MNIDRRQVRERLFTIADEKYRKFQSGLCPGTEDILGVRVPILRQFAKELYASHGIEVLSQIGSDSYEERLLQGMLIGMEKSWRPDLILDFLPKIDNWAICDLFCSSLKITRQHPAEMLELICGCLKSNHPYTIRFGIVMLLSYYVTRTRLAFLFATFDALVTTEYYVQMAVAWAVSVCLVKYFDETVTYLQGCRLDPFTYNKALQKGMESGRISDEQKLLLKNMKR